MNLTNRFDELIQNLEETLKQINYDFANFKGTLYDYCINHYSTKMYRGSLFDPIQLKKMSIINFNEKKRSENSIDLTHSEAVEKGIYYWDNDKQCILSPARPTNMFWSFHLSNMMQQNYTLDEYFEYEKERYIKRQELINSNK